MDFNFSENLVFENERVLLRPLSEDDFEYLLPIALSDEKLLQFSPNQICSEELLGKYIQMAIEERRKGNRYTFIVFDKKANQYAGSTSFMNLSNKDKRIEIGATFYGKPFQKTDLNRNCKFLLMRYIFESLEFERLEFRTDERNIASRTAIEKIGGQYEGTLRSHTLMSDDFRRNTVCYSILRNQWKGLKKGVFGGINKGK